MGTTRRFISVCAAQPHATLDHIMTRGTHFGERPNIDDIAERKDGYVRWLSRPYRCRRDMTKVMLHGIKGKAKQLHVLTEKGVCV